MSEFLKFVLAIMIIIVAAKASGYLSTRLGQPSVLGELVAGLVLGPTLLNMLHGWPVFHGDELIGEVLKLMAELGVILLMMLAGLELHIDELLKSGKVSAYVGVIGVVFPLGLGWGVSRLFGVPSTEAIFIGLVLAATSVSISAQTLMEMNVLRSRVGLALLGAAVFDDILVILLLSITSLVVGTGGGGFSTIAITLVRMIGYLLIAVITAYKLLPPFIRWIDRLNINQGVLAAVFVTSLFYAWTAEVIGGMAAITGSFMVGLFLAQTPYKRQIESGMSALAYGFFVPIFFVNIGLEVNLREVSGAAIWFAVALLIVAVGSKVVGCGIGARLSGFSLRESIQVGVGMAARGEVGLIVAAFALGEGLLSAANFSIVVFMVISAALVTPPLLRVAFAGEPETAV